MSEPNELEQSEVVSNESEPVSENTEQQEQVSTEPTQEGTEVESHNESDSEPKPVDDLPQSVQKRLGRQQKKHEREMAALQHELESMKSHVAQVYQQPQQPTQGVDENYVFDAYTGQYVDKNSAQGQAILTYQQQKQAEVAQNQYAQQAQQLEQFNKQKQALLNRFEDSLDEAADKYADFNDVVRSDSVPFTKDMAEIMQLSPNPGDFAYYLGSNPKEVQRLSKLPPLEMAKEMTKHMVEMANKKVVTNAPEPVAPIKASINKAGSSFKSLSYEQMKAQRREKARRYKSK